MPQLDNLDIFVQVVRSGSFVAAARVTGLSPSAVSKAITRLEQHLATRLMNRNTRSMALTTEGMRFYERCVGILSAGVSTAIGGGTGSPGVAALINATAAHALDYDDTFRPLMGHASAALVPALLATAQAVIGAAVNPGHYAAAWLLGLNNEEGILQAMCLAVSMAAGVKGQFGTAAKPLHAGLAARNAVEAAALAAAGMGGNPDIMDHPFGFAALYGAAGRPWAAATTAGDERHVIETLGLTPKRHPCCASTHNAIDMLLDLKAAHGFAAEDVMLLDCLVGSINQNNLPYAEPINEMQARFSMPYCLAVALANNRLRLADFVRERIFDPAIRRLLPLTKMHAASPTEEDSSGYVTHRLSVHLRDGRTLHAARAMAKGGLADPFSAGDRREKFFDCCNGRLDQQRASELYEQLQRLDNQSHLDFIAAALGWLGN